MRLWLQSWEMDCCGEPVRVGDAVRYQVCLVSDAPRVGCTQEQVAGTDGVIVLHHGAPSGPPTHEVRGRVAELWEVRPASQSDALPRGEVVSPVDIVVRRRTDWSCDPDPDRDADPDESGPYAWIIELDVWK